MDDINNIDEQKYSPPGFSNEGFADESTYAETAPDQEINSVEDHPKRARKKRGSSDRRFDELIYERGLLEQQNFFKDSLISDQQRQLDELQAQLHQKDKISNDYFETALQERESSLLREAKQAREDGDLDNEFKLIDELADIKAKKNTNSLLQFQNYEKQLERAQQINEEPYIPFETAIPNRTPPLPDEFQEWLEDNSWYNTSPRLRQAADMLAQDLGDRLALENQAQLIGTPEFFQSVTNLVKARYDMGGESSSNSSYEKEEEEAPYASSQSSQFNNNVAPVTRRGITMADQYVQGRSNYNSGGPLRSLSKDEFAIARHLPIRQKGEGEADLVRRFSQAKNYPKSPLDGGTSYRLTIL